MIKCVVATTTRSHLMICIAFAKVLLGVDIVSSAPWLSCVKASEVVVALRKNHLPDQEFLTFLPISIHALKLRLPLQQFEC
jgi:hypothetical protein